MGRHLLPAALVVFAIGAPAHAQERKPVSSIGEWPDFRWRHMPSDVSAAYAGPDGRTWFQMAANPTVRETPQLREMLEGEYKNPAPRISGASLALFEPHGRVWFYVNMAKTMRGCDGKQWTEHNASPKNTFVGSCP